MTMFSDSMMLGGAKTPAFSSLAVLFAVGADGIMIDLTDKTTLFQDANGSLPVVNNGDPVGLVLDQHKWRGLTLAAHRAAQTEKIADADFSVGALTGWGSQFVASMSVVAGKLRLEASGASRPRAAAPAAAVTANRWCELSIDITSSTSGSGPFGIQIGTTQGGTDIYNGTVSATGMHRRWIKPSVGSVYVTVEGRAGAGIVTEFDLVSLKEIDGHHATQTSTARPLWQSATNDVLFDGSNDYLATDFNFHDTGNSMAVWAAFGPSGSFRSPLGAAYLSAEYAYLLQDSGTGVMNAVMGSAGIAGTSVGSVANTTATILGDQNALTSHLFVNGLGAGSRAAPGDMPDAIRGIFVFIGATSNTGSAVWFFNGRIKRIVAGQVRVQDTMPALEFHQNLIAP